MVIKSCVKAALFTVGAQSHPHGGTVFTAVRQSGGQNLRVKRGSIFFETIQEETDTSVMDLEISQWEIRISYRCGRVTPRSNDMSMFRVSSHRADIPLEF